MSVPHKDSLEAECIRLQGLALALMITDHGCWRCAIPFVNCRRVKRWDRALKAVIADLDRIDGGTPHTGGESR